MFQICTVAAPAFPSKFSRRAGEFFRREGDPLVLEQNHLEAPSHRQEVCSLDTQHLDNECNCHL